MISRVAGQESPEGMNLVGISRRVRRGTAPKFCICSTTEVCGSYALWNMQNLGAVLYSTVPPHRIITFPITLCQV